MSIDLVALKSALATSRATTLGTTLNVRAEGNPQMPTVTFLASVDSSTGGNGENYTNTQVATIGAGTNNAFLTSWDVFTITIDGLSATASITNASATGTAAATQIADNLSIAWDIKYGTTHGVSKTLSLWDVASATTYGVEVALKATSSGSRGFGKAVAIAWAQATAAQISVATAGVVTKTSALVADWKIGATEASTDNTATGSALVMTLLEVTNGIGVAATTGSDKATATFNGATAATELLTTQLTVGAGTDTTTTADIFEDDARGDVVLTEGANEGTTSATVARVSTDRSQWTFTAG
jgi:limonene-1,2-epoxide hydrolase